VNRLPHRTSLFSPATVIALALSGLTAWGCASDDASDARGALSGAPCAGAEQDGCGDACEDDEGCAQGLYCGGDACTADCTPGDGTCGEGEVCDARGRCADDSDALSAGDGERCERKQIALRPSVPTVALLIDQSISMMSAFSDSQSRWSTVREALMDPNNGVVAQLEDTTRFGLALYTNAPDFAQCPNLAVVAELVTGNHAAIDAVFQAQEPSGKTPTGDALSAITPTMAAFSEPGPKLIILATDGRPDSCEAPGEFDSSAQEKTTDAVAAAYQQGVETITISIGNALTQTFEQDMANAGMGLPVPAAEQCAEDESADSAECAPTYQPQDKQALIDTFKQVIEDKRACSFELDGEVVAGSECEGTITLDGKELACEGPDGYEIHGGKLIEFRGASCELLKTDDQAKPSATFACGDLSDS